MVSRAGGSWGGGEWGGWDSFGALRFVRELTGGGGLFVPVWITVFVLMDVFDEQVVHLDVWKSQQNSQNSSHSLHQATEANNSPGVSLPTRLGRSIGGAHPGRTANFNAWSVQLLHILCLVFRSLAQQNTGCYHSTFVNRYLGALPVGVRRC